MGAGSRDGASIEGLWPVSPERRRPHKLVPDHFQARKPRCRDGEERAQDAPGQTAAYTQLTPDRYARSLVFGSGVYGREVGLDAAGVRIRFPGQSDGSERRHPTPPAHVWLAACTNAKLRPDGLAVKNGTRVTRSARERRFRPPAGTDTQNAERPLPIEDEAAARARFSELASRAA
jgi:hypothetical protein